MPRRIEDRRPLGTPIGAIHAVARHGLPGLGRQPGDSLYLGPGALWPTVVAAYEVVGGFRLRETWVPTWAEPADGGTRPGSDGRLSLECLGRAAARWSCWARG